MLRYACNNNNGKVDILRCASALGKSLETIFTILDLFEEIKFIKVLNKNDNFYEIELLEISDLSIVLHNEKYKDIKNLIDECENFQRNLLQTDLNTLELV